MLYAWWPPSVFVGTALFSLAALILLYGFEEPARPIVHSHFLGVLKASLTEVRRQASVRAILLLGGFGWTFFIFLFWTMQSYLVEIGAPIESNGFVGGISSLLSAISLMALSWLAATRRRHGVSMGILLFAIPCALLLTAMAYRLGWHWLGAGVLIATAMGQVLFRTLANIRLQELVPDSVRASLVSLTSWLSSLLYIPIFPIGGALLDAWDIDGGYVAIAILVLIPSLPLYMLARRHQVW